MKSIFRETRRKIRLYSQINWVKTLYINLKFFGVKDGFKFPIIVFGYCRFTSLKGQFDFKVPITTGLICFGHPFEIFKKSSNCAEICFEGNWVVKGNISFGYDFKLYIEKGAYFENGAWCTIANNCKIICTQKIVLGDSVKLGDESQILDSNFHDLLDLKNNTVLYRKGTVFLGSYIYVGNRTTIKLKAIIPDYSLIASNSLCNKDLSSYGINNLFGGVPARFIKSDITRDWKSEEQGMIAYLTIKL